MKRKVITEISSCFLCPCLETTDVYLTYYKKCPHFGESIKTDGISFDEKLKIRDQLRGWFEKCPKWKYIGE